MAMAPWPDTPTDVPPEEVVEPSLHLPVEALPVGSDSEEEVPFNNGYELLPQDGDDQGYDDNAANIDSEDDEGNESGDHESQPTQSVQDMMSQAVLSSELERREEQAELWRAPVSPQDNQQMDKEHMEKIMSAMAGFSLPSSAVPSWATVIPEEEWKTQLVSKIRSTQTEEVHGHVARDAES